MFLTYVAGRIFDPFAVLASCPAGITLFLEPPGDRGYFTDCI